MRRDSEQQPRITYGRWDFNKWNINFLNKNLQNLGEGSSECSPNYNKVDNNTWKITVNYTYSVCLGSRGIGDSGLIGWCRIDNLRNSSNVLPSNGTTIGTWVDASGYGKTATNTGNNLNGYATMNVTALNKEFRTSNDITAKAFNSFEGLGFDGDKGISREWFC